MQSLRNAVTEGDATETGILVKHLLSDGHSPREILYSGLLKAMNDLGVDLMNHEVFIAEVLRASQAWYRGYTVLKEAIHEENTPPLGKVMIATVEGDMHDIGKNLVKLFMEAKGFDVIDLGVDVSAEMVIEAVKEHRPDILALSSLLTTTMKNQEVIIERLKKAHLRDGLIIFVGGAPITNEYCKEIGADFFERDALSAAETASKALDDKKAAGKNSGKKK